MSFGLDRYMEKKTKKKKKEESEDVKIKDVKTEVSHKKPLLSDSEGTWDWRLILEETVKSMVLYPHLLDYTRTEIIPRQSTITAEELAVQLHVPLGVAIIILEKLRREPKE